MLNSETPRLPSSGQAARDEVLGRLGVGGMAEVWLLRRRGVGGFEKFFALKRIRAELLEQSAHVAMFLDEARLAAMLHHPGIVQVFDIGEDEQGFWYVMEYVRGRSAGQVLRQARLRGKPLPIECAVYIGQQVARALHYAHHRITSKGPLGLVHRDVSPGNVLLGFDGAVKLADFGVARASGRLAETVGGEFKGKYVYASPEQVRGERVDSRSDLFSLGLVLHELITGARVFGDDVDTPYAVVQAVLHAPFKPPSALQPACPPELDEVVLRAIQRELDRRFATGGELADALDRVASRLEGRASPERLMSYLADLYGDEARSSVPGNLEPRDEPLVPHSVVTGDGFELEVTGSRAPDRAVPTPRPVAARSDRVRAGSIDRTDATALVPGADRMSRTAHTVPRRSDRWASGRVIEESSGELVEPSVSSATGVVGPRRSRYRVVAVAALSFVVAAVSLGVALGRDRSGERPVQALPAPAAPTVAAAPAAAVPAPSSVAPAPPIVAPVPAPAAAALPVEPAAADTAADDGSAADDAARDIVDERRSSSSSSARDRSRKRKAKRSRSSSEAVEASKDKAKDSKATRDRAKPRDDTPAPSDLLEGIQPWTP
jgi:serine/threonine protein kinase